ncbi:MAG: mechanosensitive ion channel [Armatimonadetes bacterium]|nr:mechanosensitive ion channel [Armatimonadota bacterium]MDW8027367.1 mechanosensitive ion channel [Armatimonadota bacterium]
MWTEKILNWLSSPILNIGGASLSVASLLKGLVLILFLHFLAKWLGNLTNRWLMAKTQMPDYTANLVTRWFKVAIWVAGLFVVADFLGIKFTSFAFFAGALGVGIGFGLQTIVNNFISGLILLMERTMKVGDVISVAGEIGRVVHIGARATLIETTKGSVIAIPNSQFINTAVTNWTLSGKSMRVQIPVTVGNDADIDVVISLLLEIARLHPQVLDEPSPQVWLTKIGDTVGLELLVWVSDPLDGARQIQSDLYKSIWAAFKVKGIIPRG